MQNDEQLKISELKNIIAIGEKLKKDVRPDKKKLEILLGRQNNINQKENLPKEKIDKIIKEHIIGGSVVEEFVIPKEMWADAISPEQMRKMAGVS